MQKQVLIPGARTKNKVLKVTLIQFILEFLVLPVEEVLVEVTMPRSEGNPEKNKTCEYLIVHEWWRWWVLQSF